MNSTFSVWRRQAPALAAELDPWLVLFVMLALGLRLYRIDAQSMWADEGTSVALAGRSLTRIAQDAARDIHPPFYYWTLHLWVSLAGPSVVSVRALSAVYGAFTVGLTYVLGRRWFGMPAAALAALAGAVSPLAIHYGQETRMYALAAMLSAVTWLLFDDWLDRHSLRRLLLYGAAALAALYTHYFGAAVVAACNIAFLIAVGRSFSQPAQHKHELRKRVAAWLLLHLALVAAYLPWVWNSRAALSAWSGIEQQVGPLGVLGATARVFSVGLHSVPHAPLWITCFLTICLLAFPRRPIRRRPVDARLLAAAYVLVPVLFMAALALGRPLFRPRFLLLALPGFHLLLGHGAVALADWSRARRIALAVPVALLVLAARNPLSEEWFNPRVWRDDYRGIARMVASTAGRDDAIVLLAPGQIEIFDYYYKGALPRYTLPRQRPIDAEATTAELEVIADRHRRLYAVLWGQAESDPAGVVERWLETNAFKASDRWYGNVRLAAYEFGSLEAEMQPVSVNFAGQLALVRAAVTPERAQAGDVIRIAGEWQALGPIKGPLRVFAQILDPANHIVGQFDGEPAATQAAIWRSGETRSGQFGVPVRGGTPPGSYRLVIGLYEPDTGERLLVDPDSEAYLLRTIIIERPTVPPDAAALDMLETRRVAAGEIDLLGWRFNRLGVDHAPETPLQPGDPLSVVLFWQAREASPALPTLALDLLADDGRSLARWDWTPLEGRYATSAWLAGEIVRDPQTRLLPTHLAPGRYTLVLAVESRRVELGNIEVVN